MKIPVRMANQILANGMPTKTARCTATTTRNPIHMAMGIHTIMATITHTITHTVTHMTTTIIITITMTMTMVTITHTAHNTH
jgi:hypothetical protein